MSERDPVVRVHTKDEVGQKNEVFELVVDGDRHPGAVFHNKFTCAKQSFVLRAFDIHLDESDPLAGKHVIESNGLDLLNAFKVPLLSFFATDDARSLESIRGEINLLIYVRSSIWEKLALTQGRQDFLALLIVLRIGFERIDVVETLVAAPACEVVAGGAVKAAAVYEDFVFSCFEIIEILALVIAPVEDAHADVLLG